MYKNGYRCNHFVTVFVTAFLFIINKLWGTVTRLQENTIERVRLEELGSIRQNVIHV